MTSPDTEMKAKNGHKPTPYVVTSQVTPGRALELVRSAG